MLYELHKLLSTNNIERMIIFYELGRDCEGSSSDLFQIVVLVAV